jgi:Do/DeqQ family serine protease
MPMTNNKLVLAALAAVTLSSAAAIAPNVLGQDDLRRVPSSAAEVKASFAPVVRESAPAVVNVYSQRVTRSSRVSLADLIYNNGIPRERVERSLGSGAIVREDGIVVTNNHVVENTDEIVVVLADRREFSARVLLADARSDLAVLKLDAPNGETFPALNIGDDEALEVGDLVLAIGNPYGVGQTVTNGIISALSRTDVGITDYSFFIQTDAAINPGNSGGPLVDMDGDLIGLNTAIFSQSGGSSGIGFAIPAAMVRQVVASAVSGSQRVERPWLGARTQAVTRPIGESLGLPVAQGALVTEIYPDGPAARAGLREGDVVLAINGEAVNDDSGVSYRIGTRRPGERATLQVYREGQERTLTAVLASPPEAAAEMIQLTELSPFQGATVANLSPALADSRGLDPFLEGVAVIEVAGGLAARKGFRAGDVIVEVNGVHIDSTRQLAAVIAASGRRFDYSVRRGEQVVTVVDDYV